MASGAFLVTLGMFLVPWTLEHECLVYARCSFSKFRFFHAWVDFCWFCDVLGCFWEPFWEPACDQKVVKTRSNNWVIFRSLLEAVWGAKWRHSYPRGRREECTGGVKGRGKPLLQGGVRNYIYNCRERPLNHLSPRGLVGFVRRYVVPFLLVWWTLMGETVCSRDPGEYSRWDKRLLGGSTVRDREDGPGDVHDLSRYASGGQRLGERRDGKSRFLSWLAGVDWDWKITGRILCCPTLRSSWDGQSITRPTMCGPDTWSFGDQKIIGRAMCGQYKLTLFSKQCLHYGVLAFSRAGEGTLPWRGSRTRKIIKKPSVFKLFQKKNGAGAQVLDSTFSFFEECFS